MKGLFSHSDGWARLWNTNTSLSLQNFSPFTPENTFFPPCSVCGSEYYVHLWTLQIHISITGRCNISCVIVAAMSAMLCARTHSARPPWGRWGSTPAIYSTAVRENDSLNACGNNYDYTAETARKHRVWRVCLCVCVWACPHVRIVFEGVMLQDHTWEWALIGETRWGAFIEVRSGWW